MLISCVHIVGKFSLLPANVITRILELVVDSNEDLLGEWPERELLMKWYKNPKRHLGMWYCDALYRYFKILSPFLPRKKNLTNRTSYCRSSHSFRCHSCRKARDHCPWFPLNFVSNFCVSSGHLISILRAFFLGRSVSRMPSIKSRVCGWLLNFNVIRQLGNTKHLFAVLIDI